MVEIGYAKASVHDQITQIKLMYDRISAYGGNYGIPQLKPLKKQPFAPKGKLKAISQGYIWALTPLCTY